MKRRFALSLFLTGILALQAQETRYPDVPFVPSPQEVVEAMLKLGDAHKGDILYDLGCGDGRIVITAVKKYDVDGTGVDIDPERIAEAKANAAREGVAGKAKFIEGDLFNADIGKATLVTLYLLPNVNLKLKPKLLAELKPGARVVSHSFDMGDWEPARKIEVNGRTIYLWIIPEKQSK
jgi:ubiquinone/menaquinone biosynthesis C-methylase UbiE